MIFNKKCVWENKYNKYIKENKVNIFICVFNYMYSWNVNKLLIYCKKKIW